MKQPLSLRERPCSHCRTVKLREQFSPSSSWCKDCRNVAALARKQKRKALGVKWLSPERRKVFPKDKYLSPEQWEKLWPQVSQDRLRLYFDLLQNMGLRAHEGLAITAEDVDFTDGVVLVHSLKKREETSERSLPVRPDIIDKLNTLSTPYFPFSYHYAYRRFKQALEAACLSPRLSLHTLRHLCTTRFREVGAPEYDIGYMLRHSNKDITALYGQAADRRIREWAKKTWETQTWLWKSAS